MKTLGLYTNVRYSTPTLWMFARIHWVALPQAWIFLCVLSPPYIILTVFERWRKFYYIYNLLTTNMFLFRINFTLPITNRCFHFKNNLRYKKPSGKFPIRPAKYLFGWTLPRHVQRTHARSCLIGTVVGYLYPLYRNTGERSARTCQRIAFNDHLNGVV